MEQENNFLLYKIGVIKGCIASFIGSVIFLAIEILLLLINSNINDFSFSLDIYVVGGFILLTTGSLFISFIPAILGSIWLAFTINKLIKENKDNKFSVFYLGSKVGFLIGLGICFFITITYLYRTEFWAIVLQTAIVVLISMTISGITALLIKKNILIGKVNIF